MTVVWDGILHVVESGFCAWIFPFVPVDRSFETEVLNPYCWSVVSAVAGFIPMTFGTYMQGVAVGATDAEADPLALAFGSELGAARTVICCVWMSAPVMLIAVSVIVYVPGVV